ncbi:riboflavin synthase, alpha subunit [Chthoniobacter flavus Ellin428]|uniref:Riboflavin synthase n=1 Tax=Chthoniobacter flavus Ellin428 TaxID=497964 RepID=B4DAG3_9BACT|nr:riboflavin synthase [Chthoniobacter flavus]EDY16624.1 riboflavin synthase, alpha subunit [Chthoniobacter flavus Ellin428]TCO91957.1 riboflavin synthase alpha chain [Chthoniobacter flavus]
MFTGLVEETGELLALARSAEGARLTVRAPLVTGDVHLGDSVAVNGCCLTVTAHEGQTLAFDLLEETLARTNLGALTPGAPVNLERALAAHARLGGHFVQGHVDTTSRVLAFEQVKADYRLEIALPAEFARYVAFKGSIAIDGISLTVAEVRDPSFVVWIIPHTLSVTNLRAKKAGELVNLEFDLLAKYVERIVATR